MAHEIQTMLVAEQVAESVKTAVLMTWAKELTTGAARYIGELGKERRGYKSGCVCFGCGHPLSARKAGAVFVQSSDQRQQRPHFAHQPGAVAHNCMLVTAREVTLNTLREGGTIELPRRRCRGRFVGLSGIHYEAWAEQPAEKVEINKLSVLDIDTAMLELKDGRLIKVKLVSRFTPSTDTVEEGEIPTIQLLTDDPGIAAMSPVEIRQRLTILQEGAQWCHIPFNDPLWLTAEKAAQLAAATAKDWVDLEQRDPTIPDALQRETALHLIAKEILSSSDFIQLPALSPHAQAKLSDGSLITEDIALQSIKLPIQSAVLEKRLDRIRPDLLVTFSPFEYFDTGQLIIEITVTNSIADERLERIRATGLPALEVDLRRLSGPITRASLTDLLITKTYGKAWLHQPDLQVKFQLGEKVHQAEARINEQKKQAEAHLKSVQAKIAQQYDEELLPALLQAIEANATVSLHAANFQASGLDTLHFSDFDHPRSKVKTYLAALKEKGHHELQEFWTTGFQNILHRVLSIKADRPIGFPIKTTWDIITAIRGEPKPLYIFHHIYLLAIRAYHPILNSNQHNHVQKWREEVAQGMRQKNLIYRPDLEYYPMLSFLFPELSQGLIRLVGNRKQFFSWLDGSERDSQKFLPGSKCFDISPFKTSKYRIRS